METYIYRNNTHAYRDVNPQKNGKNKPQEYRDYAILQENGH